MNELYLHCRTCLDRGEKDSLEVVATDGFVTVQCAQHDPPLKVVKLKADTHRIMGLGCMEPGHGASV